MGLDERMKKINVVDMGLVKLASIIFGIIIAKLFPGVLSAGYTLLIALMLIVGAKPSYDFWFKK